MNQNSTKLSLINLSILGFVAAFVAMPVRSACVNNIVPSTPDSQFSDHGDGTVTDNKTGLMWAKCSEGQTFDSMDSMCDGTASNSNSWSASLDIADSSELAGYTDWRLPNIKELISLVEVSCFSPAINESLFPQTPIGAYWTSSPFMNQDTASWSVPFSSGVSLADFKTRQRWVRLVRN